MDLLLVWTMTLSIDKLYMWITLKWNKLPTKWFMSNHENLCPRKWNILLDELFNPQPTCTGNTDCPVVVGLEHVLNTLLHLVHYLTIYGRIGQESLRKTIYWLYWFVLYQRMNWSPKFEISINLWGRLRCTNLKKIMNYFELYHI